MKKVFVILVMVLLCSTSVTAQKRHTKAKSRKAKVERQMTEFEKWQKEEKLAYYFNLCQDYYNNAKTMEARGHSNKSLINQRYKAAEEYQRLYEELEKSNYYVDFKNYNQKYYNDGKEISLIMVHYDGGAEYIGGLFDKNKALALELVDKINQELGYVPEQVNNDIKNKVSGFLNQH